MPAVFVGHGNPLNALAQNAWTAQWQALARALPRPRAILCISAHWYLPATRVMADAQPRTLHDFGGFPRELFEVQYPAPGDPALAQRVAQLLAPLPVAQDHSWGLDHGAWSVLVHLFPEADIPVIQLSLDDTRDAAWHFTLAQHLAPLRDEGVLILGSGNLVHNLHAYGWGRHVPEPYDWAQRFEDFARAQMQEKKFDALVSYEALGQDAKLSVPTPEHYLPLLYVLAQCGEADAVSFPVEGVDGGSISMLAVQVGGD
jgi:4,5-DOPA dioxygenase extradiol